MCQMVAYKRLKTIKIVMPSPQKVVAVAYERWSHMEVRLYILQLGRNQAVHVRQLIRRAYFFDLIDPTQKITLVGDLQKNCLYEFKLCIKIFLE